MTSRSEGSARVFAVLGSLLVVAAAAGVAYPLWWQHRSSSVGQRLLHEHLRARPAGTGSTGSCRPSLPTIGSSNKHLAGVLEIPSLGLRAPVLQGLGDPVLNVAVGHDPASPWPGRIGESVVEAHDVSYFAKIDGLTAGREILWHDACAETVFRVTGSEVVTPGTTLRPPANSRGLALITCYPTNALFWTPERYVVLTSFVSRRSTSATGAAPQIVTHLEVPAPAALVAEGLTLRDNPILLGTLSTVGSPSPEWLQGPAPLDVEAKALESFFGAMKAIAAGNQVWWRDLAVPGLAMPGAWSNSAPLFVTIDVAGSTVRTVVLHSTQVTMRLDVQAGKLLIASVSGA